MTYISAEEGHKDLGLKCREDSAVVHNVIGLVPQANYHPAADHEVINWDI